MGKHLLQKTVDLRVEVRPKNTSNSFTKMEQPNGPMTFMCFRVRLIKKGNLSDAKVGRDRNCSLQIAPFVLCCAGMGKRVRMTAGVARVCPGQART